MSYTFAPDAARTGAADTAPAEPAWSSALEQRLLERVEGWFSTELDERVIRIVEDKLRDETERRMWRGGTGVF